MAIAVVIGLLLGGIGGYEIGKTSGTSALDTLGRSGFGPSSGQMNGRMAGADRVQRFGGSAPVSGEILSVDEKSLTVKLRDGGSRIVFFSANTPVMRMASGTPADLAIGSNVMVLGTTNPDGSVTATSLQLRPELGYGGRDPQK